MWREFTSLTTANWQAGHWPTAGQAELDWPRSASLPVASGRSPDTLRARKTRPHDFTLRNRLPWRFERTFSIVKPDGCAEELDWQVV